MKITIKNLQKKVPIYPARIKKSILRALEQEDPKKEGEITVSFVSDKLISKLNFKYLKKKQPTDVLAFNLADKADSKKILADIVVSADTALRNARIYKTSAADELNLYSIHGLLHLLGYTDHTLKNKSLMQKKESKYVHP
ncbi:MAG: rRNA maturation RNase YbeY [Candidatus Omnitrophica bacterium]|nr:rRNA maturation RNase YbeY [Candidatus Omnitrophota bacterium]MDD5027198.1 rRNA maturation RNase YbeY [Candidatus Omnitrophota bacterium]MDD5662343.1 rRNA maturation RNase YbeY [Candidatus Omnitrophota bacterium]